MEYLNILECLDYTYVEQCQPFIFTPKNLEPTDIPVLPVDAVLASPFPVFSYECDGETTITCSDNVSIVAVVAKEISVNNFQFYVMCKRFDRLDLLRISNGDKEYETTLALTNVYLERLHVEKVGTFNTSERIKYKNALGKKTTYKAKGVIYVSGKKPVTRTISKSNNYSITPLHTWSVMSHWRKLANPNTLGMDRIGDRTVIGYTWVNNYSKGEGKEKICVRKIK